jgi:hypothetical protein
LENRNKKQQIFFSFGPDFNYVFNHPENIHNGFVAQLGYSWTKSKLLQNSLIFSANNGKTASLYQFHNIQLGYLKGIYFEKNDIHIDLNAGFNVGVYNLTSPDTMINPSTSFNLGFSYSINPYYVLDKGIILGIVLYGSNNIISDKKLYHPYSGGDEYKTGKSFLSIGLKIGYRF